MNTTQTRHAAQQHRNRDIDPEYCDWESVNDYPYENILNPRPNRSYRCVNYTTLFCAITAALYLLCWLL